LRLKYKFIVSVKERTNEMYIDLTKKKKKLSYKMYVYMSNVRKYYKISSSVNARRASIIHTQLNHKQCTFTIAYCWHVTYNESTNFNETLWTYNSYE